MVYNTASDVRRVLHLDSSNQVLTDTEINTYLSEANTEIFNRLKRKYETQSFRVVQDKQGEVVNMFKLFLSPIISVYKVLVNNELLNSSNYTTDLNLGEITITSDLNKGDIVLIYFEPEIYKLLELYQTAYNINITTQVLNRGGEPSPIMDNLKNKLNNFYDIVESRLIISSWK